ncbi:MAG TPA: homoserine kinase [Pararobbsia sp.]|nr:homoserine kinase [Pararobbsia sp.]
MAVFTAVNNADLEGFLAHYSLGNVLDFRGIASGIENSNFFLTTERGDYVLTIFEKLTAEELPFYLNLMRHLAGHNVPVPDPVMRDDGRLFGRLHGKPATIVTKLDGRPQLAPDAHHCAEVGGMLAQMHLAGRDFRIHQPNLRSLGWWNTVVPEIVPFVDAAASRMLLDELDHQRAFFASEDYAALPGGPCHCDLFRDNVLFSQGTGIDSDRLGGFFDFYFAGVDKWLFDLAVTVNDWCVDLTTGELDKARADAMLRAYQAVRPLIPAETRRWRDMLRAGAYRFWVSRLYDFHKPRAAEMLKPHDPGHFERILTDRIGAASVGLPS